VRFSWLAIFLLVACGPGGPRYAPLDSDGKNLRAADGRVVVLRGMNARVAGVFDVTLDGGRAPVEPLPAFDDSDAARVSALGFNFLRLPISWSGVEPQAGVFSTAYLDAVAHVVDLCRAHGVLVLIDFHQDAWSKEIGEDGAPLWAIVPPPTMLLSGPLTDLGARRTSAQVMSAFNSFFAGDAMMLQERFAEMAQQVAMRFRGDQAVLGYELFNEPIAADADLLAFHVKAATAIRVVDAKHLILFEPSAERNFTNSAALADAPFPVGGAVYAPHIYTGIFSNDPRLANDTYEESLHASVSGARDEADSWKTPLILDEFGAGPTTPNGYGWIGHVLDDADEVLASTAFWVWKEISQASWGLFDQDASGAWIERPQMIAAVSRPYAQAIGGAPSAMKWDGQTLTVTFAGSGAPPLHDVFFPGAAPSIACDGAATTAIAVDAARSVYTIRCGGGGTHTLTLAR